MNKKNTFLGLLLTTTLLLKADDILDYLAAYIEQQKWRNPLDWNGAQIAAEIKTKDNNTPYAQELASALSSELSHDKKSLLLSSFEDINRKNKVMSRRPNNISLTDKFELKKKKQYINNLLFINSGKP